MFCAMKGCNKPARLRTSKVGPNPKYCSPQHQRQFSDRLVWIRSRYGITVDEYDRLVEQQQGRCAICGSDKPLAPGRGTGEGSWHIDHDHVTGRIRGLLCSLCNRGLGQFQDDPQRLRAAATYLDTH